MENEKKSIVSEIDELKLFYYEVLNGSSFEPNGSLFIKHFSEKESYLLLKKRVELFYYYSKEGVPHESQLLKNAIEGGEWSQEKEDKILELKFAILDNEKNIHNIIHQQRPVIQRAIDDNKKQLSEAVWEKKQILGRSLEDLVDEDVNDYVSYLSFYKDEKCKISVFESFEEFEKIDMVEILKLNKILSLHYEKISEDVIKKLAAMPFFLNKFSYTKDKMGDFLGVPLNELTHHQNHLFSIGVRNLNVLSQTEGSPPDLNFGAKAAELVHWYDIQNSIMIGKRNQSK